MPLFYTSMPRQPRQQAHNGNHHRERSPAATRACYQSVDILELEMGMAFECIGLGCIRIKEAGLSEGSRSHASMRGL